MAAPREALAAAGPRCQVLLAVASGCRLLSLAGISSGRESCSVSPACLQDGEVTSGVQQGEGRQGNSCELLFRSVREPGLIQTGAHRSWDGSRDVEGVPSLKAKSFGDSTIPGSHSAGLEA